MRKYNGSTPIIRLFQAIMAICLLASCSSVKYVGEDEYLLDKVGLTCDVEQVNTASLSGYIRQHPNARWFSLVKVPLGIYSLSGRDSSKWMNRMLQRIGEPPVIYDEQLAQRTGQDLRQALQNMGYMGATVNRIEQRGKKRLTLTYRLNPGELYYVNKLSTEVADTAVARHISNIALRSKLYEGMVFNINTLNEERQRIADYLQNMGYYKFTKEYVTFVADTVKGTHRVGLTMHVNGYKEHKEGDELPHPIYKIGNVRVFAEFDMANLNADRQRQFSTFDRFGMHFYFRDKLLLRPRIYYENNFLQKGDIFRQRNVERTYNSMARLHALKYTNIHFRERKDSLTGENVIDSYILTSPNRMQSFSAELEGTNTAGDFGAAASLTYQHKNLFKGSETFTIKLRGAYEAISGLQGYTNDNYTEYGIETSLTFPRFMFPFLSSDFKRRIRASSEVAIRFNAQERPEFTRRVASMSWSYKWTHRQRISHKLDLIDINYVYMPSVSETFRKEYLENIAANSILKYNYEDLFIARTGYSYSYTSQRNRSMGGSDQQRSSHFSIRTNIETAGNLFSLVSLVDNQKTANGQHAIFNIAYAQYVKGDVDFTQNFVIDDRNSLVIHAGLGIAYPYGNSRILPFEKRYFSGGANSVRGWSVRSLGPGSFSGNDRKIDFINQSGDLKLDVNLEYRTFMFWKIHGALFIDAGNIWTLRSYDEQPGGAFRFHSFFREIAVAYGLGIRLNFDYLILRFDGGMKAVNPAYPTSSAEYLPILNPKLSRDFAFHFAIGYPF